MKNNKNNTQNNTQNSTQNHSKENPEVKTPSVPNRAHTEMKKEQNEKHNGNIGNGYSSCQSSSKNNA